MTALKRTGVEQRGVLFAVKKGRDFPEAAKKELVSLEAVSSYLGFFANKAAKHLHIIALLGLVDMIESS